MGTGISCQALYSASFYDGGPIIRVDLLEKYNLKAPTTYDELYEVMKVFKQNEPSSYPLTSLVGARVLYRFTMPSFGISVGQNSASNSYVLSYDYDKKEYFAGAIDDRFKEYLRYMAKCYADGLLDPEFVNNPNDVWATKMSTGRSMVTWAYYDQIGGITTNSSIPGIKFDMLPPLKGPTGAYSQTQGCYRRGSFHSRLRPSKNARILTDWYKRWIKCSSAPKWLSCSDRVLKA